ncbi:MAG: aminotransferase class V-fold PLP-dependent enzyme [Herpetosiphon sp.]
MTTFANSGRAWSELRDEFPTLQHTLYLNSCSLGLLSRDGRRAVSTFLDEWEAYGAAAWYSTWLGQCAALRRAFGRLVGSSEDTIALGHSISAALSVVASGYQYRERPRIITTALDFPTIPYQWAVKPNAEVIILPSDDGISVPLERWEAAIDERTALVATSHVFFTSGYIQPVKELARMAHNVGAHVLIDGYQAAGQVPVDVQALEVDYYLAGGLKWLLGGPGIVEMFVHPERLALLEPEITGWFAHRSMFSFDPMQFEPADDARRMELGTPAVAAVYAALTGLEMVLETGVDAIRQRQLELVADLVERAAAAGIRSRMPLALSEHAGIVMFPTEDPAATVRALRSRGIIVDYRPGHVRVSPYFYNTVEDNKRLVLALREFWEPAQRTAS